MSTPYSEGIKLVAVLLARGWSCPGQGRRMVENHVIPSRGWRSPDGREDVMLVEALTSEGILPPHVHLNSDGEHFNVWGRAACGHFEFSVVGGKWWEIEAHVLENIRILPCEFCSGYRMNYPYERIPG